MVRSPNGLLLPDDCAELFSVSWDNQATEHEIDQAIELNGILANWIDGNVETDVATDAVAEIYEGDPYDFWNHVNGILLPRTGISVYRS